MPDPQPSKPPLPMTLVDQLRERLKSVYQGPSQESTEMPTFSSDPVGYGLQKTKEVIKGLISGEAPLGPSVQGVGALVGAAMPFAKVGKVAAVAEEGESLADSLRKTIKAYHGSPHDFERFDISKIGTGEGAQAYGHGLYFAENEAVARGYRERLGGGGTSVIMPRQAISTGLHPNSDVRLAGAFLKKHGGDLEAALSDASRPEIAQDYPEVGKLLGEWKAKGAKVDISPEGNMYEVAIKADPDTFLDWDKPLSQQHPKVQKILADEWLAHPEVHAHQTGADIYHATMRGSESPHADEQWVDAALRLKKAGIPGIRYLDQGSRAAGEGSRNYVVFDDKAIDIVKKYGIGALLAAGPWQRRVPSQQDQ